MKNIYNTRIYAYAILSYINFIGAYIAMLNQDKLMLGYFLFCSILFVIISLYNSYKLEKE